MPTLHPKRRSLCTTYSPWIAVEMVFVAQEFVFLKPTDILVRHFLFRRTLVISAADHWLLLLLLLLFYWGCFCRQTFLVCNDNSGFITITLQLPCRHSRSAAHNSRRKGPLCGRWGAAGELYLPWLAPSSQFDVDSQRENGKWCASNANLI